MEVVLLNGNVVRLKLRGKLLRSASHSKSKFQYRVGQQLAAKYPHDNIFEEVIVPGDRFVLDFFIPSLNLVVECHGRQHVHHVKHFHKTKRDFHKQQDVDQRKRDWCILNAFKLLEIYDE